MFADKAVYYIQHGLMAVIPYYLLRLGGYAVKICIKIKIQYLCIIKTYLKKTVNIVGAYSIEPLCDMSWSILGYALSLAYHFWLLQVVAMVS